MALSKSPVITALVPNVKLVSVPTLVKLDDTIVLGNEVPVMFALDIVPLIGLVTDNEVAVKLVMLPSVVIPAALVIVVGKADPVIPLAATPAAVVTVPLIVPPTVKFPLTVKLVSVPRLVIFG